MLPDFLLPKPPDVSAIVRVGRLYALALGSGAAAVAWTAVAATLKARREGVPKGDVPLVQLILLFAVVLAATYFHRYLKEQLARRVAAGGPAPVSWSSAYPQARQAIAGAWLLHRFVALTGWEVMAQTSSAILWANYNMTAVLPLLSALVMLCLFTPTEASAQRDVDEMVEYWNAVEVLERG